MRQEVFYIPGVGTGRGATWLARAYDRMVGGAMGLGLNQNIEDAYRALTYAYEPGDEIYLFGFSRGAFTARSLAGFIRSAGIPDRRKVHRIGYALQRYRSHRANTYPDHPKSFLFRRSYAPAVTTSQVEADWRFLNGHDEGQPLKITYLGVWDTVGALGVPQSFQLLAALFNKEHKFHDHSLSRSVNAARHAVAIDERRRTFEPTLWDNIDRLNAGAGAAVPPYQQFWFPGTHGSVGGGGEIVGLSDAAALWVAEGAKAQGLAFDADVLAGFAAKSDAMASLRNVKGEPSLIDKVLGITARDRAGPRDVGDVSALARARWAGDRAYRPKTLEHVADDLGG